LCKRFFEVIFASVASDTCNSYYILAHLLTCITLQEAASPDRPGPPAFAPPPPAVVDQSASGDQDAPHLAITQPTPSEEDGGGLPTTEDLHGKADNP